MNRELLLETADWVVNNRSLHIARANALDEYGYYTSPSSPSAKFFCAGGYMLRSIETTLYYDPALIECAAIELTGLTVEQLNQIAHLNDSGWRERTYLLGFIPAGNPRIVEYLRELAA